MTYDQAVEDYGKKLKAKGIDPALIAAIIALLIQFAPVIFDQLCPQPVPPTPEQAIELARHPSFRAQVGCCRHLINQGGLRAREAAEVTRAAFACIAESTPEAVGVLMGGSA